MKLLSLMVSLMVSLMSEKTSYAAYDDMGNMRAAISGEMAREIIAISIAEWILKGMRVVPVSKDDVKKVFGREFEGPGNKFRSYHISVNVDDYHYSTLELRAGDESLMVNDDDCDDCDDEKNMAVFILDDCDDCDDEKNMAAFILDELGIHDYSHTRTRGDIDHIRERIANGVSS